MDTIAKILKVIISLCLIAFLLTTNACADTTKIDVPTDESQITIAPFGELVLDNHVDKLIPEVEKQEECYSPMVSFLNKNHLLFLSDYFICNVDIEKAHIDWVLDLRVLYGYDPDPVEHALVFYTNLRSETTADGRFLFYWHNDKPMYLLDLADKKIYVVKIPFSYDLEASVGSIIVSNTEDKKSYEISLDTLSAKSNSGAEVTAEHTEMHTFPLGNVINTKDVLYRGSQYFVYLGDTEEFNVVDKKFGNRPDTSQFSLENAYGFYSVYKDEEAVIFECDNVYYEIYKNEVKRFSDGTIAFENIDSCIYDYVYIQDGRNVSPFKVILNLFDVEAAIRMQMELDIKSLLQKVAINR